MPNFSAKMLTVKTKNSQWDGNSMRSLHPSKPFYFETAANATLQSPMQIMRHSCHNIPFTHKLQLSFKTTYYFFQEATSRNKQHSSKNAVLLSVEVQSSLYVLLSLHSYSISFKTPDTYTVCTLSIAFKGRNGRFTLQHSLK